MNYWVPYIQYWQILLHLNINNLTDASVHQGFQGAFRRRLIFSFHLSWSHFAVQVCDLSPRVSSYLKLHIWKIFRPRFSFVEGCSGVSDCLDSAARRLDPFVFNTWKRVHFYNHRLQCMKCEVIMLHINVTVRSQDVFECMFLCFVCRITIKVEIPASF